MHVPNPDPHLLARPLLHLRQAERVPRDPHRPLRPRRRGVREPVALLRRLRLPVRLVLPLLQHRVALRRARRLLVRGEPLGRRRLRDHGRSVGAVLQAQRQGREQRAVRVVDDDLESRLERKSPC
jgi:hypothetical protein